MTDFKLVLSPAMVFKEVREELLLRVVEVESDDSSGVSFHNRKGVCSEEELAIHPFIDMGRRSSADVVLLPASADVGQIAVVFVEYY